MAKFIVCCSGRPLLHGHKRGPFKWSETHKCYVFENEVFGEQGFNSIVERALKNYGDLFPVVRIVEYTPTSPALAPSPVMAPSAENMDIDLGPEQPITSKRRPKASVT